MTLKFDIPKVPFEADNYTKKVTANGDDMMMMMMYVCDEDDE